jgi:ketosteroid isomerase-like protein
LSAADQLRAAVEARDLDALVTLLADDVVFRSPIVHKPYHGPQAVRALLEGVLSIFEDFRLVRPLSGAHALAEAMRAHFEGAVPAP